MKRFSRNYLKRWLFISTFVIGQLRLFAQELEQHSASYWSFDCTPDEICNRTLENAIEPTITKGLPHPVVGHTEGSEGNVREYIVEGATSAKQSDVIDSAREYYGELNASEGPTQEDEYYGELQALEGAAEEELLTEGHTDATESLSTEYYGEFQGEESPTEQIYSEEAPQAHDEIAAIEEMEEEEISEVEENPLLDVTSDVNVLEVEQEERMPEIGNLGNGMKIAPKPAAKSVVVSKIGRLIQNDVAGCCNQPIPPDESLDTVIVDTTVIVKEKKESEEIGSLLSPKNSSEPERIGSLREEPKTEILDSGIANLSPFQAVNVESEQIPQDNTKQPERIGSAVRIFSPQPNKEKVGSERDKPRTETLDSGIANLSPFQAVNVHGKVIAQKSKVVKTEPERIGSSVAKVETSDQHKIGSTAEKPKTTILDDSGIANLPAFHRVTTQAAVIAAEPLDREVKSAPEIVGQSSARVQPSVKAIGSSRETPKTAILDSGIANLPSFKNVTVTSQTVEHKPQAERKVAAEQIGSSSVDLSSHLADAKKIKKTGADSQGKPGDAGIANRPQEIAQADIITNEPLSPPPQPLPFEIPGQNKPSPLKGPAGEPVGPDTKELRGDEQIKTIIPAEPTLPMQRQAPAPSTPSSQPSTPTPPPAAQPPAVSPSASEMETAAPANKTQGFLINFNNVGIIEYIRFISKITGKNFIFDESELQFNVTIISEEPTTLDNIMAALLQELRIHGLSLIEQGNNLIIHTNVKVNSPGKIVPNEQNQSGSVETRVFVLTTLDAAKAADIVRPLLSAQSLIETIAESNNLIITDITANIDKIALLLKNLDSSTGGFEVGQYLVRNTVPDSLINLAEQIMTPLSQGKTLVLVPHGPTNSIFIVASPVLVKQTIAVLQNLDVAEGQTRLLQLQESQGGAPGQQGTQGQPNGQNPFLTPEGEMSPDRLSRQPKWTSDLPLGHVQSTQFFIHKLQYRRGDQIVDALQKIADSLEQTGSSNNDLVISIRSVQWLESSNSLVFTGTRDSVEKIKELIEEIDTALRQVFIEVLILDTTIDDSLEYGVDWGARFATPTAAGAEAFLPNTTSVLNGALDGASLIGPQTLDPSSLARTQGFNLGIIGRHITRNGLQFNSIGALVHALHNDTCSNIILNPKLLVEDNTPAEIFVGINAPFKTQSIANDLGNVITNNFEFRDIGTTLRVTPLLGNGDMITLDIEQEVSTIAGLSGVSSISGTAIAAIDLITGGPTTKKSKTTTRIHVPDTYFVVMSGMIQEENIRNRNQLPCLGPIPVLGAAFSSKRNNDSKRNIMLFIRPRIIDRQEEYDEITKRQQDIFKDKSRKRNSWKFEVDEALDFMNLQSTDPRDVECP